KSKQIEARCYLVLAGVALAQSPSPAGGKEAQQSLARATELLKDNNPPALQLWLAQLTAQARVAAGANVSEARKSFDAVLADLGPKPPLAVRLEARCVAAQLQAKSGAPSGANSALPPLQQEAASKGFLLAARRAKETRP